MPPEELSAIQQALAAVPGRRHRFVMAPGAGHGYMCEARSDFHPQASAAGWGPCCSCLTKRSDCITKAAGRKIVQGRVKAHEGEAFQLSLRSQQAIKGVAMGLFVSACNQAMLELNRQQFKSLVRQNLRQI